MTIRLTLATLAAFLVFSGSSGAADSGERTSNLIATLKSSDASLFEKARACQQLGEFGTAQAVPTLASLLSDPQLAAYARSGLEGIADPTAATALREATGKLKGPLLAGVVNSLGAVRDPKAVELLVKLASDTAAGVQKEALMALGNISSPAAVRALERFLSKPPGGLLDDTAASCLLAAERQLKSGQERTAQRLYDAVRKPGIPIAYRVGATRGAILARGTGRVSFLIEQLRSSEPAIRNAALLTVREVPEEKLATALNRELKHANPELQQLLLLAIADCHDAQSIAAIEPLAVGAAPAEVRRTALSVLGRLGPDATPILLAKLQQKPNAEERTIIVTGLRSSGSPELERALVRALRSTNDKGARIDLIRLLESRGAKGVSTELFRQAAGPDNDVTLAALSALGSLAETDDLPALLSFSRSCPDEIKEAAEAAVARACARAGDDGSQAVLHELRRASTPAEKISWARILGILGDSKTLPDLESAAAEPNVLVAGNAITQLGRWPNADPGGTLLVLMQKAPNPGLRSQARLSLLELCATATDEGQCSPEKLVGWLKQVNASAATVGEKRRILGILGRLKTFESFQLLEAALDDPELRTEAASGVIQVAPELIKGPERARLKAALDKISQSVTNQDIRDRSAQLSRTIQDTSR